MPISLSTTILSMRCKQEQEDMLAKLKELGLVDKDGLATPYAINNSLGKNLLSQSHKLRPMWNIKALRYINEKTKDDVEFTFKYFSNSIKDMSDACRGSSNELSVIKDMEKKFIAKYSEITNEEVKVRLYLELEKNELLEFFKRFEAYHEIMALGLKHQLETNLPHDKTNPKKHKI